MKKKEITESSVATYIYNESYKSIDTYSEVIIRLIQEADPDAKLHNNNRIKNCLWAYLVSIKLTVVKNQYGEPSYNTIEQYIKDLFIKDDVGKVIYKLVIEFIQIYTYYSDVDTNPLAGYDGVNSDLVTLLLTEKSKIISEPSSSMIFMLKLNMLLTEAICKPLIEWMEQHELVR